MSDQNAASSPASASATATKLSGRSATLGENFEIFFDHAMPRFNQPGVKAYQARGIRGGAFIALVCERTAFPRVQVAEKYRGIQNNSAARFAAKGIVRCPDNLERYALLYEASLGQPLVPDQGEPLAYGWRSDLVFNTILKPVASLLFDMHNSDLVHGGIRASNLFDGGVKPLQRAIVGDCLAQTYAAAQPTLYLPPPLAMSQPMGRGIGNRTDDIYALGVTCAVMMRTHDPMAGKSEQDILISKLEFGSFSTLIGNERIPSNLLEMLRGLLQDDPLLRWDIADLHEWFEGRRGNQRQGLKRLKASRHIVLGSSKILQPNIFVVQAVNETTDAGKLIENGEVKQWLTRSISDSKLDERYEHALESNKEFGTGMGSYDRLISRVAVAFEPTFPLAYKGVRALPESLGYVLAEMIVLGRDPKPIADLIIERMPMFWMNMQFEPPADINLVASRYEMCQQFLKQRSLGYGLERCLYTLAPDIPCLSPKLRGFYVSTPEEMLIAFNTIADMNDRPEGLFDWHIAAFLSVRDRKAVDIYLPDLGATERYRQITGLINTLASIQSRSRMQPLPSLTRWLAGMVDPLYERFHDRDLRTTLRKRMNDVKDTGMVIKIADLLLKADTINRDQYDFRNAMREYYNLKIEDIKLGEAMSYQDYFGTQSGREIAALVAGLIMTLVVTGFLVIRFNEGLVPW